MLKEAVCEFPFTSTAVYVTVVVPTGNDEPDVLEGVNVETEQLSLAVGAVHVTVAAHKPAVALTVMSDGIPLMVGSCVSFTVMVKLDVLTLP
jgi:hypothetical protein